MIRWLVIGLLLFGITSGAQRGWVQVRWGLMLHELGVPFVAKPPDPANCPSQPAAADSSSRQAL
ncbi:MAG: hypothetical protein VKK94_04925 [Cyanobacteriota bacterium]|nr:hypothetical protein [Cyanobacteriota bacterium]